MVTLATAALIAKDGNTSSAATWTPAVFVASCALLFTVASFWWLNVRRGRLKSFEPHSFAAYIGLHRVRVRFPLVFYNTGAVPIVIQNLRLRFLDEPAARLLPWVATRSQIKPESDDGHDFPAVFSVSGRSAFQSFQEFDVVPSLGFILSAKDYRVRLEAKLGHKKDWCCILVFTLRAWRIGDPGHFITYENTSGSLSEKEREEIQLDLEFAQLGTRQGKPSGSSGAFPPSE